jgi:hypothetical protein
MLALLELDLARGLPVVRRLSEHHPLEDEGPVPDQATFSAALRAA